MRKKMLLVVEIDAVMALVCVAVALMVPFFNWQKCTTITIFFIEYLFDMLTSKVDIIFLLIFKRGHESMNKYSILFKTTVMGICLCLCPLFADDWANDQGSAFTKGEKNIDVGLALWPFGISGSFDYGIHRAISAGYLVGIMIFPDSYVPMIVRAAFHPFNLAVLKDKISVRDKLDVYAGLSSGFKIGFDPPFTVSEYIGVRYFFTPKFGVFAEDCAGIGYLNFGIGFKL